MSIILNNQKKSKQVKTVNKIKERKVVEHNDLISSVAKMDKTPLKIFNYRFLVLILKIHQKIIQFICPKKSCLSFLMCQIMINIQGLNKQLRRCRNKRSLKYKKKKRRAINLNELFPYLMLNGMIIMMKLLLGLT